MTEPASRLPEEDRPDIGRHLRGLEGGEENGATSGQLRSVPAPDGDDLSEQETQAGESSKPGRHLRAVGNDESPDSKGPEKSGGKKTFLDRLKGNKRARGGIIGGILGLGMVGGGFGLFTVASGPYSLIQWGEDLKAIHMGATQEFQNKRSTAQWLYLLMGRNERGRLGVVGNKMADKWEKRLNNELGLKSVYNNGTGRLVGYEITDEYKASEFKKDMPTTRTLREGGLVDASGTPYDQGGREVIDLRDDRFKTRREFTRLAAKSIGTNKFSTFIGQRLLITRGGIKFHVWKNIIRQKGEDILKFNRRVDEESVKYTSGEANVGGVDTSDKKSTREKFSEIKGKVQSLIKTAKGPLIAVGALCGLRAFSSMIDAQNLNNMQVAARMGMESVNGASQTQSMKDYNLDQLGVYAARLYDPKTKTSVTDDKGVQYEMGTGKTGFDYTAGMRPTADNDKPWFFDAVDIISTPLAPVCDLMSEASDIVTSIPGLEQAFALAQGAIDLVIKGGTWLFTGEARSLQDLIDAGVKFFATQTLPEVPVGAMKGGIDNMGVRWAMNDQMLALGGRNLSPSEAKNVKHEAMVAQKQKFASSSWYDRYLNPAVPGSAVGTLALATPRSRSQLFTNMEKLPTQLASMLSQSFGLGKAFAAPVGTYDYGFQLIGFSLEEQDDPTYENPFQNEQYMLEGDRLERMNDEYGKDCFFMTIDRDGNINNMPSGDLTTRPSKCDNTTDPEYKAYRFYKADLITEFSNACYEGDEESCTQVGFNGKAATSNTAPADPSAAGDLSAPSDTLTCTVGTDGGVQDGYYKGNLVKIRVCVVGGIRVNVRIAANIDLLLKDASAAGIKFTGTGFATMQDQLNKRKNNHCPDINTSPAEACTPRTAIPGFSNHQMGEAIDFSQDGKLLTSGQSGFKWLQTNAGKYGLKNLPDENWHWSVDGG